MSHIPGLDVNEVRWLCWYMHSKNEINRIRIRWLKRLWRIRAELNELADSKRLALYDRTIKDLSSQIAALTKANRSKVAKLKHKANFYMARNASNFYIGIQKTIEDSPLQWLPRNHRWQPAFFLSSPDIVRLAREYEIQLAAEEMLRG